MKKVGKLFSRRRAAVAALCPVLAGLAMLAPAAGANTKTRTLGSTDPAAAAGTSCDTGVSWVQRATASTRPKYTVPANGTITSWTTSSVNAGTEALKIWAPTSKAKVFKPVAESAAKDIPAGNGLTTFSTHLAVQKGDVIGMAILGASNTSCLYDAESGDITSYVEGDPKSGKQKVSDCLGSACSAAGGLLNISVTFKPA